MYDFTTLSGTKYQVEDGRITRLSEAPILLAEDLLIQQAPFRFTEPPKVGERFFFRLTTGEPVLTNRVTAIRHYCRQHDLFDCWLCNYELEIEDARNGHGQDEPLRYVQQNAPKGYCAAGHYECANNCDLDAIPVVELPGSQDWRDAWENGSDLEQRFPGQDGRELAQAICYNDLPPGVAGSERITALVMTKQGAHDLDEWRWVVAFSDGSKWQATGGCDYTGWDCRSFLNWTPAAA